MRRLTAVFILFCLSALSAAAQTRTITETDLFRFVWVADPQMSPDGSRIAFVRVTVDDKKDGYDTGIWIVPANGSEAARPLTGGRRDHSPRWSADGTRLAFVRAPQKDTAFEPPQVFVMAMSGGEARAVTAIPRGAAAPVWSPDGA